MISDEEKMLRPPQNARNPENTPYSPKFINLATGDKMIVRQLKREEVPILLKLVYETIKIDKDYYDLVGVRLYGELLSYLKYRVRDEYVLVGVVNGEIVAQVNGRQTENNIGVSYHTMAFKRGLRAGAHMFAAKMEYHLDYLKNDEVYIVAESPIGFRRWQGELRLEEKFEIEHELGGVPSFTLTRKNWEEYVKPEKLFGSRPVPDDLLATAEKLTIPENPYLQITGKKEREEPGYWV